MQASATGPMRGMGALRFPADDLGLRAWKLALPEAASARSRRALRACESSGAFTPAAPTGRQVRRAAWLWNSRASAETCFRPRFAAPFRACRRGAGSGRGGRWFLDSASMTQRDLLLRRRRSHDDLVSFLIFTFMLHE